MYSGSLQGEINHRLTILYERHHDWLSAVSYNLSKNKDVAEDLVQELYVYLLEKQNPKLFFNDSFNLLYCHNFLSSRWINLVKRENKNVYPHSWKDTEDVAYDTESDIKLEESYQELKDELTKLGKSKGWASVKIYELYTFSDKTMEQLSEEIGISKSTTFLNVKKVKQHLKNNINNPFNEERG